MKSTPKNSDRATPVATAPMRLDIWASVANAPTATPLEFAPKGAVFRGMKDLEAGREYAQQVCDFFAVHGCKDADGAPASVFVVQGPTTTTTQPFEVVDAACGYYVLHRSLPSAPSTASQISSPAWRYDEIPFVTSSPAPLVDLPMPDGSKAEPFTADIVRWMDKTAETEIALRCQPDPGARRLEPADEALELRRIRPRLDQR